MTDYEPDGLVCPTCRADYVPGITECSDCGVALVEPMSDVGPLTGAGVAAGATTEGAVARGWRDAMSDAGVAHRIEVAREHGSPTLYTLHVGETDRAWAETLVAIIEERPGLDASDAVDLADDRLADRAEAALDRGAPEGDDPDFDVPDLLPPPEVMVVVGAARTKMSMFLFLAFLLTAATVVLSPWWGLAAAIAVAEAVRSRSVARARLAEWERDNDARYPHEANTSG